jgi:Sin3 binding region of histone deacetylase complex subunit SAP30
MAIPILDSGIGKNSPTMSRAKKKRRISKEQLALAVRKNFNAQPVNENEAIVELLYRIRMKGMPQTNLAKSQEETEANCATPTRQNVQDEVSCHEAE